MKRITFFILALIAIVTAGDKSIEDIAKHFQSDVETLQACMDEDGVKIEDLNIWLQKSSDQNDADVNIEELKETFKKYSSFLACILERNGMMVDTKLVADKIFESMKEDGDMMPQKDDFMKCLNLCNENSKLTREERALGLLHCIDSNKPSDK